MDHTQANWPVQAGPSSFPPTDYSSWADLSRPAGAHEFHADVPVSPVSSGASIHSAPAHVQESIDPSRTIITHVLPNPHSRQIVGGASALARSASRQAQSPSSFGMARSSTLPDSVSPNLSLDLTEVMPSFLSGWDQTSPGTFSPHSGGQSSVGAEMPSLSPMTLHSANYFSIPRGPASGLATPLSTYTDANGAYHPNNTIPMDYIHALGSGSTPGSRRTSREEDTSEDRPRARVKRSHSPPSGLIPMSASTVDGLFPEESALNLPEEFLLQARSLKHNGQFIVKLFSLLLDSRYQHLIEFAQDGASFTVHDVDHLAADALPVYFKHAQFSSFVRQLNMYGFSKRPPPPSSSRGERDSSKQSWNFTHSVFHRDRPHDVLNIRRKIQGVTAGTAAPDNEAGTGGAAAPTRQSTRPRRSTASSVARLLADSDDSAGDDEMAPADSLAGSTPAKYVPKVLMQAPPSGAKHHRTASGRVRQPSAAQAPSAASSGSLLSKPTSTVDWLSNANNPGSSTGKWRASGQQQRHGPPVQGSPEWNAANQTPSVLRPVGGGAGQGSQVVAPVTTPSGRYVLPGSVTPQQFQIPDNSAPPSPVMTGYINSQYAQPLHASLVAPPAPPSASSFSPSFATQSSGMVGTAAASQTDLDRMRDELSGLQAAYKSVWLDFTEARNSRAQIEGAMSEMYSVIQQTNTASMRKSFTTRATPHRCPGFYSFLFFWVFVVFWG